MLKGLFLNGKEKVITGKRYPKEKYLTGKGKYIGKANIQYASMKVKRQK